LRSDPRQRKGKQGGRAREREKEKERERERERVGLSPERVPKGGRPDLGFCPMENVPTD
jgi:hypothetical protein